MSAIRIKIISNNYYDRTFNVSHENNLYTLEEDVFLDCAIYGKINDGVLEGDFIWAQCGSKCKIIRVGSELHKSILEYSKLKDKKALGKNNIEVGGIYKAAKGAWYLFLGYVNTTSFTTKDGSKYFSSGWNYYTRKEESVDYTSYVKTFKKKQLLFYKFDKNQKVSNFLTYLDDQRIDKFSLMQSHPFVEKVEHLDLSEDVIHIFRTKARKMMKETISNYCTNKTNLSGYKQSERDVYNYLLRMSDYINIYDMKKDPVDNFEIKNYLMFF